MIYFYLNILKSISYPWKEIDKYYQNSESFVSPYTLNFHKRIPYPFNYLAIPLKSSRASMLHLPKEIGELSINNEYEMSNR